MAVNPKLQGYYEGIPSFFRAPVVAPGDVAKGEIAVLGAPFDGSTVLDRPGARFGPRAIREASCYYASYYFDDLTYVDLDTEIAIRFPETLPLVDVGDADCFPMDVQATTESVASIVGEIINRGGFPVTLGGDHYLAYPSFKGVAEAIAANNPGARLGYVHVDSHLDLRDQLTFVGRYNHASGARRVSEHPVVALDHMVWIGLNGGVGLAQYRYAKRNAFKLVTAKQLEDVSWSDRLDEALAHAAEADYVYVSIDIDVVDGAHSPGTCQPVYEGISPTRFFGILERIGRLPNLVGIDCCEVAPTLDPLGRTARLAAQGLLALIAQRVCERAPISELEPSP